MVAALHSPQTFSLLAAILVLGLLDQAEYPWALMVKHDNDAQDQGPVRDKLDQSEDEAEAEARDMILLMRMRVSLQRQQVRSAVYIGFHGPLWGVSA